MAHWLTSGRSVDTVALIAFYSIVLFLRDKSPAFRFRAAIALGTFAIACFAALYLLP